MKLFTVLTALAVSLGAVTNAKAAEETAIVAGGCFWCVESDFESVAGVREVVSGYTGGDLQNPTYDNHSGHLEAVEITFDNTVISYQEIIHKFLRSVDVLDAGGQFCDRGAAYATAIFANGAAQKAAAEAELAKAQAALGKEIVTPLRDAMQFWVAEDYHQNYYKGTDWILTRTGPKRQNDAYKFYRAACGRDARVKELWGDAAAFAK